PGRRHGGAAPPGRVGRGLATARRRGAPRGRRVHGGTGRPGPSARGRAGGARVGARAGHGRARGVGGAMPGFTLSGTARAPVEEVWKLLFDPTRFPEWWAGVERVRTGANGEYT